MKSFALAALSLTIAQAASAAVIGFDTPTGAVIGGHYFPGTFFEEGGFRFTNSDGQDTAYLQWTDPSLNADPDGLTLSHNYVNTTTVMERIGGGIFDLFSIDLADVYDNGSTGEVLLSWTVFGGGSGSTTVTLDSVAGLQTFALNLADLTSFSILPQSTEGPWIQMDNFVVDGTVPVPATLPLLGAALAGLSLLRRRKSA